MESLYASCAAEPQLSTSGDVKLPAQIEEPSLATREGADGLKDKTGRGAEQQANLESPQKGGKATDDLWLQVKTEIKEEIEDDMRSSSFDCELPLQNVRVKDENAEEQHQNPKNSGYEVATEEMVPEQSMIPARSQATAEPESKPAKRRRLTRRDVQKTMHTEGLNSAKKELPDAVKVKTERCAEQQVKLESPQKRMEMDDFQLRVKTEIKEGIEDEMRSSSFDCELPLQDVRVKDENAEEQHQNLTSCGYEVATEMVPEQSVTAAKSQTAAETEPKPAKRRRLTRRDLQQTLQTDGLSSAKKEIPDGVKVKTEKCAEQQANLDSPQKRRMEMDDLWLRVREEIRKQSGVILAASSPAAGNAMRPSEQDSGSSEAQASCQRHQEPSEHSTQDTAQVVGQEDFAAEESSLDAFALQAAAWAKQCLAFRSSKTWSPTRPCCPANLFLGSAIGTPSPPPPDAPACVLRLSGHGLQCLQRFYDKHSLCKTPFESEVEASGPCLQTMPPKPPSDCDLQMQDYKVRGLDCMKMWPWMRDLPTSVWAGHGWAFDESGLRRLSSSGGSNAMQGVEVFESLGLAEEEVKPSDEKIEEEAPIAVAAAENPLPTCGEQKPNKFTRNNVAKQSGVPNVTWNNNMQRWYVVFYERDAKGQKTRRTTRNFSVKNFMGPGISEAQADAAALEAAKAFHAELVEKGILSEPRQKDPNFTSEVPGVSWEKNVQKWRVRIWPGGSKGINGGLFTEKAAAEAKALELVEKDGLQRRVKPVATLSELPVFHPKVPYRGVSWEQRSQQWYSACLVAGAKRNFYIRPKDHSEAELERSFQVAVAWKKKQEKEKAVKSRVKSRVKSKAKPGKKQRK